MLGIPHQGFLRYIGDPTWKTSSDESLRDLYTRRYEQQRRSPEDIQNGLDGEAIAHLRELYHHDRDLLSPQELAAKYGPVLDELEGFYNGAYTGKAKGDRRSTSSSRPDQINDRDRFNPTRYLEGERDVQGMSLAQSGVNPRLTGMPIEVVNKYQSPALNDVIKASGKKLGDLLKFDANGEPIIKYSTDDGAFRNSLVSAPDGVPKGWHVINGQLVYKPYWYEGRDSLLPSDMRDMALRQLNDLISPKYDYFFRATNRKDEPNLVREAKIRASRNHADNTTEEGLSVADAPHYITHHGYKYGYKIAGREIGTGSDGEPVLDLSSLKVISEAEPAAKHLKEGIAAAKKLQKEQSLNLPTIGFGHDTKFEWFDPAESPDPNDPRILYALAGRKGRDSSQSK